VIENVEAKDARKAMAGFFTRILKKRPYVTLKLALSLDGCIAMHDGTSQWITGEQARAHTHIMRCIHDAILVGSGTIKADMPSLDVRLEGLEHRSPARYQLGTSQTYAGFSNISTPKDIANIPHNYLIVEGGAQTATAFLQANLVDRLLLYRAPIIIGGKSAIADYGLPHLNDAHNIWHHQHNMQLGKDVLDIYERV